ncbi:hypothetical protein SAMN05192576_2244 [Nocardioides szechwanensis]|uniref:Uncharacterized protein n=1 Tax=Nocardioides szechwanensis TaxID=1005944 RepID=A0A1H0BVJ9_9ACTN|nr:hypothetical protein [Nocardioides szechwanensis]SDN49603.1 hypothetical protein SAMN05192576_2244 [Nocardioides szechwanensis]
MRREVIHAPTGHHPGHPGVVVPARTDPAGVSGPTKPQARGRRWRRSSPGLYVPADVSTELPEQRIVEAAQMIPGYGGVTGWAALCWQGGRWFRGDDLWVEGQRALRDVTVATMIHARSRPGVVFSEERLNRREILMCDGLPLTIAARSVCFEARYAPDLRSAVRVFDMAAYNDIVSLAECAAYLPHLNGWTGVPQCREAFALAEENAWSPREVDMRLAWRPDPGGRLLLCNVPVFDLHGQLIGTPDLLDPVVGIVGEYDGAHHLAGPQRSKDVRREAAFRAVGLEYVTMLAADLADPHHFEWRLRDCYGRAARRTADERRWTLQRPPWWVSTDTVAQRRALTESQRARLLAHRLA